MRLLPPRRSLLLAVMTGLLAACGGAAHQRVPAPPPGAPVAASTCRVYLARQDVVAGSWRNVRVFDDDTEIGVLGEHEYLCWDRPAGRGVGSAVFEGIDFRTREVENVFDLPREGGTTAYYGLTVNREDRQPRIERLSEADGRALIAQRRPAKRR
ncbi:MAG TPA: hypothetical protein VF530_21515 [Planctomycetota bacterium]